MAVRPEQEASKTRVCPGPRNTRKAIFLKQRRERQLESHKNTQAILSILHCGSAALGMRKCRFEDAEVPLWECGSAALSAISHCRMTFFALLAMLFIYFCATRPCLHLIKTGKKRRRNGFPKRCFWYEKSVWILRFIGLTYVNAYIGTANSQFAPFCILRNMFT